MTTSETPVAPQCYSHWTRTEMVDYIARLLMFDTDGSKCDTAMGLMRWNNVTGAELNARRADPNRPIYLPL